MTTRILAGPTSWSCSRDKDGHRDYKVKYLVAGDKTDGPANVLQTPGLPTYGANWQIDADLDLWAWCRWDATVTPKLTGEPNTRWELEFTFSTKPPEKTCKDNQVEDPLLEPTKVSGSFKGDKEEATHDRFGQPVTNSAHEQMRGPQVEFDAGKMTIKIEQNVPLLQLGILATFQDSVNAFTLWGLPPRTIKLSSISFERKFQGSCQVYYTRSFEFEVDFRGWDRDLLDEGTKVLNGHWDHDTGDWVLDNIDGSAPDKTNPTHFIRFKDRQGENARVLLDGNGSPSTAVVQLGGDHYVSLTDVNLNLPLSNNAAWLALIGPWEPDLIVDWEADLDTSYVVGNCVTWDGSVWVRLEVGQGFISEPGVDPEVWRELVPEADWQQRFTFAGPWVATTTYSLGDIAQPSSQSGPASIHVEKYEEKDFLLLGVPIDF